MPGWSLIFSILGMLWCLCFFFPPYPPPLGNKHICASSSIYYYISTLNIYLALTTARRFDTHTSLSIGSESTTHPPSHASRMPTSPPPHHPEP